MIDRELQLLTVSNFIACELGNDKELLDIVEFASTIVNTPMAGITILDEHTLYLKVAKGIPVCTLPRELSYSDYTVKQHNVLVVPDALSDERFATMPFVTGAPHMRFYAGAPLIKSDGQIIGTLFLGDDKENNLDAQQQLMLKILAGHVMKIMELRAIIMLLESKEQELEMQAKMNHHANLRLRSFFESAANFKVLVDKNGEVIDFNRVAYNFVRSIYKAKLKTGDQFVKYLDKQFAALFTEKFNQSLKGRKAFAEGSTKHRKAGMIFWEATFEASRDVNNDIIGVLCQMRDVTERKLKEQKIIDQNQSLLQIAHIQAHEFRGPLTTIMGLIDLMHEEQPQKSSEYLILLKNAVGSLDNNINQVINHIEGVINHDQKFAMQG